ncbi:MAG: BolA/IbaG family iron-sulfur metabolism protein [Hyphomicrobiales bacterium]|jgi:stress-induced morphogen|nr:BolA family transcriptional regulator [Rhodobiaceae bacterium]NDD48525.1 BolA family transcriptional regulator [Alphaproteobacteria bacterium]RPF96818.1 MAG: BolA family transcriptional regulator [Rhizobiales bacterium TMED227]
MSMKLSELQTLVQNALPDAIIEIKDLAGDDNHYSITIKSEQFRNKSRLEQHQIVYSALQDKMGTILHALQIKTISI